MAESGSEIVNAPANLKSKVWKHFGFAKKNGEIDKTSAVCRICKSAIKYLGNTTNLASHLLRRHGITEASASVAAASSANPSASGNVAANLFEQKLGVNTPRAKAITASIAKCICTDLRPYSVVENAGFREMVKTLEPRYKIPSRQFFSDTCIPKMYEDVKNEVKQSLFEADRVAITTDGWTSCSTEGYVTITAHLINKEWAMRNIDQR